MWPKFLNKAIYLTTIHEGIKVFFVDQNMSQYYMNHTTALPSADQLFICHSMNMPSALQKMTEVIKANKLAGHLASSVNMPFHKEQRSRRFFAARTWETLWHFYRFYKVKIGPPSRLNVVIISDLYRQP